MATDSLAAAKELKDSGRVRSCLSRAYYSAYAAMTDELVQTRGPVGSRGRENPGHEQMVTMALHNLDNQRYTPAQRREIKQNLKRLLGWRIEADYDPNARLGQREAVLGMQLASRVSRILSGSEL